MWSSCSTAKSTPSTPPAPSPPSPSRPPSASASRTTATTNSSSSTVIRTPSSTHLANAANAQSSSQLLHLRLAGPRPPLPPSLSQRVAVRPRRRLTRRQALASSRRRSYRLVQLRLRRGDLAHLLRQADPAPTNQPLGQGSVGKGRGQCGRRTASSTAPTASEPPFACCAAFAAGATDAVSAWAAAYRIPAEAVHAAAAAAVWGRGNGGTTAHAGRLWSGSGDRTAGASAGVLSAVDAGRWRGAATPSSSWAPWLRTSPTTAGATVWGAGRCRRRVWQEGERREGRRARRAAEA